MQDRLVFASLLLAVLASGCTQHHAEVADARIGGASRDTGNAVAARAGTAGAAVATDRYVEMSGRKSDAGFAFVQTTPDVWAPFDVQVHTGFFDPEQIASPVGVEICLEIDDVGFQVFYDVCAEHDGDTWTASAFRGAPRVDLLGSVEIDADEIELRVEQTGGNVNFYARAFGAMSWSAVSSTPFPAPGEPLKVAFGVLGITKGTAAGFDGLLATFSAPPVAPTGAVAVAADVNTALSEAWNAHLDLDAGVADFTAAGSDLGDASDALADAAVGVAALPESKDNQGAAKHIAKAGKSLEKAQDQVADEDAAKALKTLEKLGRSLVEAALLLNPQPFPPPT